jgi:hypothetical protein
MNSLAVGKVESPRGTTYILNSWTIHLLLNAIEPANIRVAVLQLGTCCSARPHSTGAAWHCRGDVLSCSRLGADMQRTTAVTPPVTGGSPVTSPSREVSVWTTYQSVNRSVKRRIKRRVKRRVKRLVKRLVKRRVKRRVSLDHRVLQ